MTTPEKLIEYWLTKNRAYIDYPFGPDIIILKIRKRIFAQFFMLKGQDTVTLS